jgi:hypothetical protein
MLEKHKTLGINSTLGLLLFLALGLLLLSIDTLLFLVEVLLVSFKLGVFLTLDLFT